MTYAHPHTTPVVRTVRTVPCGFFAIFRGRRGPTLKRLGMQMKLPKRAIIFQEDDLCDAVTIVCMGQVKLSCTSREGKTHILKIAVPGDVLGMGAAISNAHFEVTRRRLSRAW